MVNTIELSVCGGDAVLCQIALISCLIWCRFAVVIANYLGSHFLMDIVYV